MPRPIIIAPYLGLFSACILLFLPIDTVAWLGDEDGPIEVAGALSFLLAGIVFLVTAHQTSRFDRQYGTNHIESPLALLALGALCLLCFGEEISWGQRLFHYPVPAWLEDINRQGEWTVHNLAWFQASNAEEAKQSFWARQINMERLFNLLQLSLFTLVPMLTPYSTTLRTWGARIGLPIVPWWIAGLTPAHILITLVLYTLTAESPILHRALAELKETEWACIFLVVAVWAYTRTTATPSVSAGARPHDAVGL
jgi:hypothetical protein